MQRIYLHIGLHKTATTFFQQAVFPALSNEFDIIAGRDTIKLVREITTTDNQEFNSDKIHKLIADLTTGERPILITSENLSGNPGIKYMNRSLVLNRLADLFPKAQLILGLREHWGLIGSMYKLYIQNGGTKTFDNYVFQNDRIYPDETYFGIYNRISLAMFNYCSLLDQLVGLFGKANIHIFNFEQFKLNPQKEADSMFLFLGATPVSVSAEAQINSSISWDQIEAFRHVNKFCKSYYHEAGILSSDGILAKFMRWIVKLIKSKPISYRQYLDHKEKYSFQQDLNLLIEKYNTDLLDNNKH